MYIHTCTHPERPQLKTMHELIEHGYDGPSLQSKLKGFILPDSYIYPIEIIE